ncbi:MAG: hypothetical protein R3D57_04965 [Hyphomicrobiaceae bacterium]
MALDRQAGEETGQRPATDEPMAVGVAPPRDTRELAPVRRVGRRRAAGPARERIAANDDSPSIGGLIYALQQQPSRAPYKYASLATLIWGVVGTGLAVAMLASVVAQSDGLATALLSPTAMAALAVIGVPIALVWFLAYLSVRTQELKNMSSTMAEVAIRLAEPDRLAEQQIASLGQSVRRQVGAMNDAISRALGRAAELEAMVHGEVAELERSYGDNEHRIRALIDELVSERDALANSGDRVAETLRGVGAQVSHDIFAATDQAARRLAQAGSGVADQLSEKGNSLYASLNVMNQRIGTEVPSLLEKLGGEQTRLTRIVEGAAKNLAALETALAQRTGSLEATLGERTGHLQRVLSEFKLAVEDSFAGQAESFGSSLGERLKLFENRARALDASLGAKFAEIDASVVGRIDAFDRSFDGKMQRIEQAMTTRSDALDAALIERTRAIDAAFVERLRSFDDSISRGASMLDSVVADRAHALRHAMESHADALGDVLRRQAGHLDQTLVDGIEAVRHTSEQIAHQSVQAIGGLNLQSKLLKEVSEDLLGQIGQLTERFERHGQMLMSGGGGASMSSYDLDRIRTEAESQTERALADLRSRFQETARDVNEQLASLTQQMHRTTSEAEERARAASSEFERTRTMIEGRAGEMPRAARESAVAIRKTLQDQLTAIERLSQMSREQRIARDVTPPESVAGSRFGGATGGSRSSVRPQAGVPATTTAEAGARDGWSLADLLKRASKDEDERGASSVGIDLAQISQAVDAGAAANAWSRYRNGERGVFTRQIYTRQGQLTFDEITHKLRTDASFRNMAERYLADFERHLRDADQKDASGRTALAHLAAETGRVYLLFAHASGRLG